MKGKHKELEPSFKKTPGVGAYEIPSKMIESPGKSMSKKFKTSHFVGDMGRGPASYLADKAKKDNVSVTMGSKLEDLAIKKNNYSPGPAKYDLKDSKNTKMPNSNLYSFGRDRRGRDVGLEESLKLPGVGKYDNEVSGILNSSPKVGFGTGPRQGIHDPTKDYLPGPGTYKNN